MSAKTTVLVASSDTPLREMMRGALVAEGFELILCGDGAEAVESAKNLNAGGVHPQLVVLEAFLPKIDGFEVVKHLGDFDSTRDAPILMLIEAGGGKVQGKVAIRLNADDYLEKPFETAEIRQKAHSMVKYFRAHAAPHPLTRLLGHPQFEQELFSRLNRGESFSTIWIDINHFRAFNDHCGRERGDAVIQMTVELIQRTLKSLKPNNFEMPPLAHVNGDDFILLVQEQDAEKIRQNLKEQFRVEALPFYSTAEQKQGFFYELGRDQKQQIYPLMTLCTIILNVSVEKFVHYGELVSSANDLLRQAKLGAQDFIPQSSS